MLRKTHFLFVLPLSMCVAVAQPNPQPGPPPNVSQVVMWSTLTSPRYQIVGPFNPAGTPNFVGLLSVYTDRVLVSAAADNFVTTINSSNNYDVAHGSPLSDTLSANIAVALSVIPLASPTSGVIYKTDPRTGADLPVSSTLGPIFTQRAESIGKNKFYFGVTHQNYHFSSLNGQKLNGLSVLYAGGDPSQIRDPNGAQTTTAPSTFNAALDVRLSQSIASLTWGVTNHFDVSVGLPMVHAAVASTTYNGIIYSGTGLFDAPTGSQCWCINTFTPGAFDLYRQQIGRASLAKTGFGDLVLRFKDALRESSRGAVAIGADLRLPTGDETNYLGTGTTSVKPFLAVSLYSKRLAHGIVLAPHFDVGWQFSGKSILGGTFQVQRQTLQAGSGAVPFYTSPFALSKDYLPDIFSWGVGSEIALGRRSTVAIDFLGNQIGWIHGSRTMQNSPIRKPAPIPAAALATSFPGMQPQASGLSPAAGKNSFGQYSGAFGYKFRISGNLIGTFDALVRFDDSGLKARFVPLYGLGYSF